MPPSPQKERNLEGKVAIVTGASRGLGAGFALDFAQRGAKVVLTYTSSKSDGEITNLRQQIEDLDGESIAVRADLREHPSAEHIVRQTLSAFGAEINILVNNAGAEVVKPLEDITPQDFYCIFHLNVLAPLLLLQAVRPHLRNGRIVNIGSVGARAGFPELSLYCSSKAALEGMTRCWAAELGEEGHTVNAVNPGPVQSKMLDNIPQDIVDMQKKQTPVGRRLGTVDDVAQIVSWLASEETGVDGSRDRPSRPVVVGQCIEKMLRNSVQLRHGCVRKDFPSVSINLTLAWPEGLRDPYSRVEHLQIGSLLGLHTAATQARSPT